MLAFNRDLVYLDEVQLRVVVCFSVALSSVELEALLQGSAGQVGQKADQQDGDEPHREHVIQ